MSPEDAAYLAGPYPAHEYLAPAHPGGLPGWNRCEDDRMSTVDDWIVCDRPEDDPIHDLPAAQARLDLLLAYATTAPMWVAMDYPSTAAYVPLYRGSGG